MHAYIWIQTTKVSTKMNDITMIIIKCMTISNLIWFFFAKKRSCLRTKRTEFSFKWGKHTIHEYLQLCRQLKIHIKTFEQKHTKRFSAKSIVFEFGVITLHPDLLKLWELHTQRVKKISNRCRLLSLFTHLQVM